MSEMQIQTLSETIDLTMSSREIAELCEKEHRNVKRDIEKMLNNLKIDMLTFERIYKDSQNREQKEYKLPKDLTMTLITGYRDDLRFKVIKRVEELEAQKNQPAQLDDPNWLRGTLLTYTEKVLALQSQVDELLPSHQALERIAEADGSMCITDAAKALQMRPKDLFTFMRTNGWIYKRSGSSYYVGYQSKTTQGLLEHKVTTVYRSDGTEKVTEQVRVTPKGLTRLAKLINPAIKLAA